MKIRRLITSVAVASLFTSSIAIAHDKEDQLGKVTFATSCNPKAHAQFETGVAMLHSFWFAEARKTFESALKDDPNCAIAYWGIALDYLGNSRSKSVV